VIANVRERLALSKLAKQTFDMERFNSRIQTRWKVKKSIRFEMDAQSY
jgi:hypothetical protein